MVKVSTAHLLRIIASRLRASSVRARKAVVASSTADRAMNLASVATACRSPARIAWAARVMDAARSLQRHPMRLSEFEEGLSGLEIVGRSAEAAGLPRT